MAKLNFVLRTKATRVLHLSYCQQGMLEYYGIQVLTINALPIYMEHCAYAVIRRQIQNYFGVLHQSGQNVQNTYS